MTLILHIKCYKPFNIWHDTFKYECQDITQLPKAIRAIAHKYPQCKCWFEDQNGKQLAYGNYNTRLKRSTYLANECIFEGNKV